MKKLLCLLPLLSSCTIVPPGHTGVRVILGEVQNEPLYSGVYFWFPVLYGNSVLNTRILKHEIETISASSDLQTIYTKLAINWQLDASKVPQIYKDFGDEELVYSRVVVPAANESMKYATAHLSAEQILKKRIELKNLVDEDLQKRLAKYNVLLTDLSFTEFHFSKEFTDAIERKQMAEQRALQAKYEAETAAQEAQAEINRARGSAEAQRLMKQTLTSDLLRLEAIRKWDGRLPSTLATDDAKLLLGAR